LLLRLKSSEHVQLFEDKKKGESLYIKLERTKVRDMFGS